jgi:hypothetical protein
MIDNNNLNLITRLELLDTLKVLASGNQAGIQITALLNGTPSETAIRSENDIFDIQFDRDTLETIAYAVEQYAYALAEPYVGSVEKGPIKHQTIDLFNIGRCFRSDGAI